MIRLVLGAGEVVIIQDGVARALDPQDQGLVDVVGKVSRFDPIAPYPELAFAYALIDRWGGRILHKDPAPPFDPDVTY